MSSNTAFIFHTVILAILHQGPVGPCAMIAVQTRIWCDSEFGHMGASVGQ